MQSEFSIDFTKIDALKPTFSVSFVGEDIAKAGQRHLSKGVPYDKCCCGKLQKKGGEWYGGTNVIVGRIAAESVLQPSF